MRVLLVLLLFASPAWSEPPNEDLQRLNKTLTLRQAALHNGELSAEDYRTFVDEFRPVLEHIAASIPHTSVNVSLHQDILRRLEASATGPGNASILAEGRAAAERGDYAEALASADLVLRNDPTNAAAFALRRLSQGRGRIESSAGEGRVQTPASPALPAAAPLAAKNADLPRVPVLRMRTGNPAIERYNSLGDSGAESPSIWERAVSFATRDEPTIDADFTTLQRNIQSFELPPNARNMGPTDDSAMLNFIQWVRTARREDLPPIDYTIIDQRLFGFYQMASLSKGSISMSHRIRDAEVEARSAVLMHELYHYWDKKVAHLHYENVSYGKIGDGSEPQHEYNAYQLAAFYWQRFKPQQTSSRVAAALSRIPTDPDELQRRVDAITSGGE